MSVSTNIIGFIYLFTQCFVIIRIYKNFPDKFFYFRKRFYVRFFYISRFEFLMKKRLMEIILFS